jgi:hypothetical protein
MTNHEISELLERASTAAPVVDVISVARGVRRTASRRHRNRVIVVPIASATAVVSVLGLTAMAVQREQQRHNAAVQPGTQGLTITSTANHFMSTNYVCCPRAEIEQAIHPGGTFTVHWSPELNGTVPAGDTGGHVTLQADLTGPYPTADAAKMAMDGTVTPTFTAAPLTLADHGTAEEISSIPVPTTASPGIYDFRVTMTYSDGATGAGSSLITITP